MAQLSDLKDHTGPGHKLVVEKFAKPKLFRAILGCECGTVLADISNPTPKDIKALQMIARA